MKVAIIGSRGLPPRYGGFEVLAHYLAKEFSQRGWRVYVYCLDSLRQEKYHVENVVRIFQKAFRLKSLEKLYLSMISTFKAVLRDRVDVIVYLGVSAGLIMWLPKLSKTSVILNPDGLEWKRARWNALGRWFLKVLERLAVKWADRIIADNEAIGRYLKEKYGVDFVFAPYGCTDCLTDDEKWHEISNLYNISKNEYYLVVGRAVPENNYDIIFNGFLKSSTRKKLVVVTNKVPDFVVESHRIIFTGPIYDLKKLNALRKNAFAYIHGHSVGGTNPSLLEAIGCESLVIAYDVPFNREVLGEHGFYFKDAESLSILIMSLENGFIPDLEKIRSYYRTIKEEKYNWAKVTGVYARLVEELAKNA
ncbi:MAG: DUF1972 domain-containing protein [candidate division WOR-3 bacterium]